VGVDGERGSGGVVAGVDDREGEQRDYGQHDAGVSVDEGVDGD